jgi:hypothetical protein
VDAPADRGKRSRGIGEDGEALRWDLDGGIQRGGGGGGGAPRGGVGGGRGGGEEATGGDGGDDDGVQMNKPRKLAV